MKYLKLYEELFGFGKKEESPSKEQGGQDEVHKKKVSVVFSGLSDKIEKEPLYKLYQILNNLFLEGSSQSLEFFSTVAKVLESTQGLEFSKTPVDVISRLKNDLILLKNIENLFSIIETGEFTDNQGKKFMYPSLKGEVGLQQLGKFVNSDQKMRNASDVLSKLVSLKKESNKEIYKIIESMRIYVK